MNTHQLVLVTLVVEEVLEERVTQELMEMGASGFTVCDSRGRGSRGLRTGDIPGQGVRVEALVSPEVADAIFLHAESSWFPHYAVVAWRSAVEVVRGDKYVESRERE